MRPDDVRSETSAELLQEFREAKAGNREARNRIVESNIGLVHNAIKRYSRGGSYDDLFQMGSIGLMKAAEKFDPDKGVKFSTYATHSIYGWFRYYLDQNKPIKIPKRIKENAIKISRYKERHLIEFGTQPTEKLICTECQLTREEYKLANNLTWELRSLEETFSVREGEQELTLHVSIGHKDDFREKLENEEIVVRLMEGLTEKEKMVISKRYFDDLTQNELAQEMNHTQSYVSRIEAKALNKMKKNHQAAI